MSASDKNKYKEIDGWHDNMINKIHLIVRMNLIIENIPIHQTSSFRILISSKINNVSHIFGFLFLFFLILIAFIYADSTKTK